MGHVDDAHLAEDDGETERHQHVNRKQDQSGEALHRENGAEIANRIIAKHAVVLFADLEERSDHILPVMRGLDPRIHHFRKRWIAGSSPAMTAGRTLFLLIALRERI